MTRIKLIPILLIAIINKIFSFGSISSSVSKDRLYKSPIMVWSDRKWPIMTHTLSILFHLLQSKHCFFVYIVSSTFMWDISRSSRTESLKKTIHFRTFKIWVNFFSKTENMGPKFWPSSLQQPIISIFESENLIFLR